MVTGLITIASLACSAMVFAEPLPFPLIDRFENFGAAEGIPTAKVHAVLKTSDDQLWIGTWNGLCRRGQDGSFKRLGPEHGLSHKMVLCMVEDPVNGDLWVGTMRGLNRVSAGKIDRFTQMDSGLPNNVVYGVTLHSNMLWAATAAGTGAFDLKKGDWKIYDHNNTVMHEPWCYSVTASSDRIFIGAWGGGIIEHDLAAGSFKEYRDPDRDFHYDLVPDDGPINDITSWVAWQDGLLWQCTYFGFSRYDGKNWKTWVEEKTPLISNFTQFVWPHRRVAWIGTDRGVSVTDGQNWVNYSINEAGEGVMEIHQPGRAVENRGMGTTLANALVLGIHVDDNEAWFAT
jgi:ligand-binding sensor domain-containing protein